MKKTLIILLMTITHSIADYSSSGSADSKGEAYIKAMSQAPSGSHWAIYSINYSSGYSARYSCMIIWKQK